MRIYKNIIIKSILLIGTLCSFSSIGQAYERIVILYAPVSEIVKQLVGEKVVVGVTRTDLVFKKVYKVGSHLRPNLELIKAIRPDLIIAGSKRAYPEKMESRFSADFFRYDPTSIEDIFKQIRQLGDLLQVQPKSEQIITQLKNKLKQVQPLPDQPKVVYEISERPLRVAGKPSIMTAIIEYAGGLNMIDTNKKHVVISTEIVVDINPDFYIYQDGPMNKNPRPPIERSYFKPLRSKIILVDQYLFSRPGLNVIDAIVKLNQIFKEQL
ncbi:MAG: ABC transporter substrate-binding protein [Deltaproteobacteria bacterium]|jgi:iron complex transport system substrate-binding protein|nr:ABC transporter substrate-binding protein [Deltaproteobacteria bacterium]MBT4527215.1 ABC transporter substrate-binding protein [Deltaproteobacteria bacterium]